MVQAIPEHRPVLPSTVWLFRLPLDPVRVLEELVQVVRDLLQKALQMRVVVHATPEDVTSVAEAGAAVRAR